MIRRLDAARCAIAVAGLGGLVILAALIFEHGFGYIPCPLCLQQRWPYYIGIPLAVVAAAFARSRAPRSLTVTLLVVLVLVFLTGTALGIHHAGVEWGFWAGPAGCSGGDIASSGMMDALRGTARIVRCDEAAWRFLGLSFAGWNAVISAGLTALAALGAYKAAR